MDWHLVKLKEWCDAGGKPPLRRLQNVAKTKHEPSDTEFLEKYLFTGSDNIQLLLLKILCESGHPVSKYIGRYFDRQRLGRELPNIVEAELVRLAEEQGDPESIVALIPMNETGRHACILALKRMGAKECLTPLLLSKDETLADLVRELMK